MREQERGGGTGGREGRREGGRESRPELPPQSPEEQARAICLRLLTGMPRTRRQLADALDKRGIPEEVSQEVLSRFEEVGLIDDAAFAGAWVESRHRGRGLARRALAQELRTKG
ncbi:regulatory protein RecX, partial [Streptomyces sp. NPDC059456]|uniref:regulatory protein RecX n=1 Tax=Streptomyces sp. NPDC059456 TaxID=3346838 RepID=UPI0036BA2B41